MYCNTQNFVFFKEQDGIAPQMFKSVIGRGHPEFSSNRQQDAEEFFTHLFSTIDRTEVCVKLNLDFSSSCFLHSILTVSVKLRNANFVRGIVPKRRG